MDAVFVAIEPLLPEPDAHRLTGDREGSPIPDCLCFWGIPIRFKAFLEYGVSDTTLRARLD